MTPDERRSGLRNLAVAALVGVVVLGALTAVFMSRGGTLRRALAVSLALCSVAVVFSGIAVHLSGEHKARLLAKDGEAEAAKRASRASDRSAVGFVVVGFAMFALSMLLG